MRASLDLLGRSRPVGTQPQPRPRSRFVRDGEVQVETVNRRQFAGDGGRVDLEAAQAALATEREARLAAEAALRRAEEVIHSLRTRLGDTEIRLEQASRPKPPAPPAPPAAEARPPRATAIPKVAEPVSAQSVLAQPVPAEPVPAEDEDDDHSVQWWKPGWRDRFRRDQQG